MTLSTVLAEIAWDPEIRNILALGFGILVLFGSVLLLVGSNTGIRTGMLISVASLASWMVMMGAIWAMYGIGMKGSGSHWRIVEINRGNTEQAANEHLRQLPDLDEEQLVIDILAAHPDLEETLNPDGSPTKVIGLGELLETDPSLFEEFDLTPADLNGWHLLTPSNKQRGDASAAADAALAGTDPGKLFASNTEYKVIEAYDLGGKNNKYPLSDDAHCAPPNLVSEGCRERVVNKVLKSITLTHPEHFAVVQVQPVVAVATVPGEAPATPKIDPDAPVYSVVMVRSLGDLRFPAIMITLSSGLLLVLCCWALHRRDKLIDRNRAAPATA